MKNRKLTLLLLSLFFIFSGAASAADVTDAVPLGINSAKESGAYGFSDDAKATLKKNARGAGLQLQYTLPPGKNAALWTKNFPATLNEDAVNQVTFQLTNPAATAEPIPLPSFQVEIKGSRDVQYVDLPTSPIISKQTATLDWKLLGELREVVLVVRNKTATQQQGVWQFHYAFAKVDQSKLEKIAPPETAQNEEEVKSGYHFDFLAIAFFALAAVIAGTLIRLLLTRRLMTPTEKYTHAFVPALLFAAASKMPILSTPNTFLEIFQINGFTSAVFIMLFFVGNFCQLHWRGRMLSLQASLILLATPFAFSGLLGVGSFGIATGSATLINLLICVGIVFCFNELLACSVSILTSKKLPSGLKLHGWLLGAAVAVIAGTQIVDSASSLELTRMHFWERIPAVILLAIGGLVGLWMEGYLITGLLMDAVHSRKPTSKIVQEHCAIGFRKGAMFTGIFFAIIEIGDLFVTGGGARFCFSPHQFLPVEEGPVYYILASFPYIFSFLLGSALFPLAKTIIESFDGSHSFFYRLRRCFGNRWHRIRGGIFGLGIYVLLNLGELGLASANLPELATPHRALAGLLLGVLVSSGVNFLRDACGAMCKRGKIRSPRAYLADGVLAGFAGAGLAFYFDAAQLAVVLERFGDYAAIGHPIEVFGTRPLINHWSEVNLGEYSGGVELFFMQSLDGVLKWSVVAWLFAINRTFLLAALDRSTSPIRFLFTREGMRQLLHHTIEVMRWGLWMSPIILTFLRSQPDPTWYNQDGAIRTIIATINSWGMTDSEFVQWSLGVFILILSYDWVRIGIWAIDHMGLRVATLVNFSFLGMDRLDGKIAKFVGKDASGSYVPEGIKRFVTWAPLLIPYYMPAGKSWDYVWQASEAMRTSGDGGVTACLSDFPLWQQFLLIPIAAVLFAMLMLMLRTLWRKLRGEKEEVTSLTLSGKNYEVSLEADGSSLASLSIEGYDVTRRAYEKRQPCGRALFVVDATAADYHAVLGNYPEELFARSELSKEDDALVVTNTCKEVKTTIRITIPDEDTTAELWEVTLENLADEAREFTVVPYLEWVLNNPGGDLGHTQYNRLFPEMSCDAPNNAVLALHRYTKLYGVLACDTPPEGYLTSRIDFVGRAQSLWNPHILETLDFHEFASSAPCPTFDAISSLLVLKKVEPGGTATLRFLIGCAEEGEEKEGRAVVQQLVQKYLGGSDETQKEETADVPATTFPPLAHGEVPPGTPQPYWEYRDEGRTLRILTPFTPRPFDHVMSNSLGHTLSVTNRGLHCSTNGNSQQNRLTPDWADTTTCELPSEAIYLFDTQEQEWFSPTYHPLSDAQASHTADFSTDGTATFQMKKDSLETELTTFVPTEDPVGVYLLTIRNNGKKARTLRCASYFRMVLAQSVGSENLRVSTASKTAYFRNPNNTFRKGVAFASTTADCLRIVTRRGEFYGDAALSHPELVATGVPAASAPDDTAPVAALLSEFELPAGGEVTLSFCLGQSDSRAQAEAVVKKYNSLATAQEELEKTRRWWSEFTAKKTVTTNNAEFDQYLPFMAYQTLAERIWARRGFYQASGAFGFRDQLQDSVNMIWVDPQLARNQLQLHAAQQFLEGDVVHWFFREQDGRTGFACRSYASDNLLWLGWGVGEYVRMTGDKSLLDEKIPYLDAESPLQKLPEGKHGMGFYPLRSSVCESVYKHCLRAFDLVLNKKLGPNGLPLIGAGDWNDGLDEIGSEGRGESTWLGFFLYYIMRNPNAPGATFLDIIAERDGDSVRAKYEKKLDKLRDSLEATWRGDRYLRAIHDDGTEIGVAGSGIWEIDALTAAWSVISGINPERAHICFDTAITQLSRENVILLGYPALREDSKPYLGRSSRYPEGVRENGMYSHGCQWLVRASRLLSESFQKEGNEELAEWYRAMTWGLWYKIAAISHTTPDQIEIYGGQPNKQAADYLTTFTAGRMIWNGYTGAAGWMFRQAFEGVVGAQLRGGELVLPEDLAKPRGELVVTKIS